MWKKEIEEIETHILPAFGALLRKIEKRPSSKMEVKIEKSKAFADAYQFTIALFSHTRSFQNTYDPPLDDILKKKLVSNHPSSKALLSPVKSSKGDQNRLIHLQKFLIAWTIFAFFENES